ncbi:hypothetical protein HNR46_001319 [Haloferula luteola]|uniref:Uncharacterized protein n=1 Tax=Haloferula luteola TaxID=595692 RepID=A0A840UZB6_9BACT|nr:hypothetical protein [Haloferula luteola]
MTLMIAIGVAYFIGFMTALLLPRISSGQPPQED